MSFQVAVTYKWPHQATQIESMTLGLLRTHLPEWGWSIEISEEGSRFLVGERWKDLDNSISLWLDDGGAWVGSLGRRFRGIDLHSVDNPAPESALAIAGMFEGLARMRWKVHQGLKDAERGVWIDIVEE